MCIYIYVVGGFNLSEKYEFVSWDYYSQLNGKIINLPNHQPDILDGLMSS
jgi:hypothetical protein